MHHCGDPDPPRTDLVHAVGAQRCAGATLDENPRLSYGAGMRDPKFIDDLARRLTGAMPASAKTLQTDLEKNLRAAMQSVFGRLDLVTREEFGALQLQMKKLRKQIKRLKASKTTPDIKPGAVVIDVGINRVDDPASAKGYRIVGDVVTE